MTTVKIVSRYDSSRVLFECEVPDGLASGLHMRHALEKATQARANLSGADLRDADLRDAPKLENIHQTVYAAANAPGALDMGQWHKCGTTHCRAGWVVTLAGEEGKALEDKIGTPAAAMAIYLASDIERWKTEKLPDFYCDNDEALDDMRRMAEEEAAKGAS